jgi:RimJ/RimL family protein N-acetyltransferase
MPPISKPRLVNLFPQELQKATASEPLTLEEEYAMQRSWRTDVDKLTFIVCKAPVVFASKSNREREAEGEIERMIGDVNLFLYDDDEEHEDEDNEPGEWQEEETVPNVIGEIEIMIAHKTHQGRGLGQHILLVFMWYILNSMEGIMQEYRASSSSHPLTVSSSLKYLRVKIGVENERSIRLFERVGFKKVKEEPNYFGELELRWVVEPESVLEVVERLGGNEPVVVEYLPPQGLTIPVNLD